MWSSEENLNPPPTKKDNRIRQQVVVESIGIKDLEIGKDMER